MARDGSVGAVGSTSRAHCVFIRYADRARVVVYARYDLSDDGCRGRLTVPDSQAAISLDGGTIATITTSR